MSQTSRKPYAALMSSPVGLLGLTFVDDMLAGIDILASGQQRLPRSGPARECVAQLNAYFSAPDFRFDLPLLLNGTAYQQRVWCALQRIKPGSPRTYGELAHRLSSGARAVGSACRANPIPIVIPCHRVVAATGPGGYSGAVRGINLDRKLWLLKHEAGQSEEQ